MIAGRYSLEREIGRGGMGSVWLGCDELLGREVALKRIGMSPGATEPDLARAEREAKLAARVNHPHGVAVLDLVDDDDEQWLVMEHVEGLNLAALVRRDGRCRRIGRRGRWARRPRHWPRRMPPGSSIAT